jgi:hypothetical protein
MRYTMMTDVDSKTMKRKDSRKNLIKIILFLYDHQLSSIKEICRYDGYKNYKTTANYVNYLLNHKIIFKVPFWNGERFYVKVEHDQILKTRIYYHSTKHRILSRLDKIMNSYPQLKENISKNGIDDFTKINKSNIPKQPISVEGLDSRCTVVVKYLNLILLATKIMILEENRSRKNNTLDIHMVKKEARICEFWLDLESFLDIDFCKTPDAEFICMAKSRQISRDYKLYQDYFAHIIHSKTSFSEIIKALTQIKLGRKQEYADSHGISMQALSKVSRKFTDSSGRIDTIYLSAMHRIETGSSFITKNRKIIDLFTMELMYDDLLQTRWADDDKSKKEKLETRKFVKQIFPEIQVA